MDAATENNQNTANQQNLLSNSQNECSKLINEELENIQEEALEELVVKNERFAKCQNYLKQNKAFSTLLTATLCNALLFCALQGTRKAMIEIPDVSSTIIFSEKEVLDHLARETVTILNNSLLSETEKINLLRDTAPEELGLDAIELYPRK